MDEKLRELLYGTGGGGARDSVGIRVVDDAAGEIEFKGKSVGGRYVLKPLAELYGEGLGMEEANPRDEKFLSLLHCVEGSIVRYDREHKNLSDGMVSLALSRLGVSPDADVHDSSLALSIQCSLRLLLSLNDFSRQQVRGALRRVTKSVQRHGRDGRRGYLDFVGRFVV